MVKNCWSLPKRQKNLHPFRGKKHLRKIRRTLKLYIMPKQNEYFKKMLAAKKSNAKSFTYKGKTYKQTKSKTGLIVYKAAK